jgi:hypothetical protein
MILSQIVEIKLNPTFGKEKNPARNQKHNAEGAVYDVFRSRPRREIGIQPVPVPNHTLDRKLAAPQEP